jgi:hypothetical protein
MKRALAERAKQSLQHEINNNHRIAQQPPVVASTITTASVESSYPSLSHNSKLLQTESHNESLRASNTGERRKDDCTAFSESPSKERPLKIPRLENAPEEEQSQNNASLDPHSPRVIVNHTALTNTSSGGIIHQNGQPPPPLKRRFSMDPPQRTLSSNDGAKCSSSSKKRTDNDNAAVSAAEEDANSAFYLKHQNRALATELKSLQFAVSQLEEEREARRQHCHAALQAVNELQVVWMAMEEDTIGPSSSITHATSFLSGHANMDTSHDPPSTGTGDSVEWTRALQNSLVTLGQPRPILNSHEPQQQRPQSSNTDRMDEAVSNIAKRAKLLQEWLATLLQSGSTPVSQQQHEGQSSEQRLHNLQREMAVVTARCAELEARVLELAASRQDVVSRERRVRRNIYRMAAEMLSPEQVVNLLEQGGEDEELEAAVQLEKQQIKSENHKAEAAIVQKQEDVSESKISADLIFSAQLHDFHAKISDLEEALASANKHIHDVRAAVIIYVWALCESQILLLQYKTLT